jgi:dihydrofolate reductase
VLTIVAAYADNRVIGAAGKIPWHLSEDLKRYKALTTGKTTIMGRLTYESIGKALPNRRTIVVSTKPGFALADAEVAPSLEKAIELAGGEAIIAGGGEIYRSALALADRMELTEVHRTVEGDAFFPEFDRAEWTEVERVKRDGFDFVSWARKR